MNTFLLLGFFTDIINTLFRNVSDTLRWILIPVFFALGIWCLTKCLIKKKEQINYSWLVFAIIFITLAILYIVIR